MHLSESSSAEVYINTKGPEQRVRMLRPRHQLLNLPPNSTDIFEAGLLEHYVQRPNQLENECLADFAANYRFQKTSSGRSANDNYAEFEDQENNEPGFGLRTFKLRDNSGFNVDSHRSDYFREMVMLYYPWRNEQVELVENDNESTCSSNQTVIEANRKKYNLFDQNELENVLSRLRDAEIADNAEEENVNNPQIDEEFRVLAIPEINPQLN
ncbi:hypothetical protein PSTG_18232, partial [Puccinia striiformis f. sp. tritici PST-78]